MGGDWYMAPIMYFVGFFAVITACIILKKTELFAGDPAPFVMELPPYHLPAAKNVLLHTWERVAGFLKKAGTIIFLCCVVMWFLASFGVDEGSVAMVDTEKSFVAYIGNGLAPIFAPLGFDSWQAVAAAFSGFVAKESIVSTMAILSGLADAAEDEPDLWTAVMAFFRVRLQRSPSWCQPAGFSLPGSYFHYEPGDEQQEVDLGNYPLPKPVCLRHLPDGLPVRQSACRR